MLSMLLGRSFGCLSEVNLVLPKVVSSSLRGTLAPSSLLIVPCIVGVNPWVELIAVLCSSSLKAGRRASLLKLTLTLVFSRLVSSVVPRGESPASSSVFSRTLMFSRCLWLVKVLAHYVSVYRILLGPGRLAQQGSLMNVLGRLLRTARWGWVVVPGTPDRQLSLSCVSPMVTLTPLHRAT